MGDFKFPNISWEYHDAVTSKSGKFLKVVDDDFLTQVLRESTSKDALLHLLFVNKEGHMGDVMINGCLSHSGHGMVEFKISCVIRKNDRRVATLDFKSTNFKLFKKQEDT